MNNTEKRRLLKVRNIINKRRPEFLAFETWRLKRIRQRWRKPTGIDNKMRTNEKGWPKSVNVGWRGPKGVRNLHPSGKKEVLIYNINDLTKIDVNTQVGRISSNVGLRKKEKIIEEAGKIGIKLLNVSKITPKPSDQEVVTK
ncbi:50S ribosomal protein L32e [Candidatus Bathyarchaeota archaeon]|nr:50S ribosomal protein L32e [Candidatus Bathyarchaeota archaeon]